MKILHITTSRSGSTGRTASDLKSFITLKGHEYRIAFSQLDNKPLNGDMVIGCKLDYKIHAFLSRLTGLQGYFSFFSTKKFLKRVKAYSPDIVVMGNLHANYINLPLLFKYLAKEQIPVVMILHDCWFYTGKCTHFTAIKCEKWRSECGHCPAKTDGNKSWLFDFSTKMYRDRMKWYGHLSSHTVVAVSDWERQLAEQSPLFSKANVVRIYNWINTDVFKPASQEQITQVREKYHLSPDINFVISVTARWKPQRSKTKDAIKLSKLLPKGYKLIIVGNASEGVLPENIKHIPYTSDQSELAALYSLSTAYFHFSVEDTFGKVIAEAMASGTVPIVFNSTACGETASIHGVAVTPHEVKAMVDALPLACDSKRKEAVRQYALENYFRPKNIDTYLEMYKSLL